MKKFSEAHRRAEDGENRSRLCSVDDSSADWRGWRGGLGEAKTRHTVASPTP